MFIDFLSVLEAFHALARSLGRTTVRVASLPHLIAIERASRRSKDLDDAERLSGLLPLSRAGEKGMP
jgi:hypothetical protein